VYLNSVKVAAVVCLGRERELVGSKGIRRLGLLRALQTSELNAIYSFIFAFIYS